MPITLDKNLLKLTFYSDDFKIENKPKESIVKFHVSTKPIIEQVSSIYYDLLRAKIMSAGVVKD